MRPVSEPSQYRADRDSSRRLELSTELGAAIFPTRHCARAGCGVELDATRRADARYCGSGCRGLASRERTIAAQDAGSAPNAANPASSTRASGKSTTTTAALGLQSPSAAPAERRCEVCAAALDELGLRQTARYCCPAHRTLAHRQRKAELEREAEAKRERVRAVRRAAAARRKAERERHQAREAVQRRAERAKLKCLRDENDRLRSRAEAAARLLRG